MHNAVLEGSVQCNLCISSVSPVSLSKKMLHVQVDLKNDTIPLQVQLRLAGSYYLPDTFNIQHAMLNFLMNADE